MCVQCNIWTFCNPETGNGCDNTCDPAQFNYDPANPGNTQRFGPDGGCAPGNQWPKCELRPPQLLATQPAGVHLATSCEN